MYTPPICKHGEPLNTCDFCMTDPIKAKLAHKAMDIDIIRQAAEEGAKDQNTMLDKYKSEQIKAKIQELCPDICIQTKDGLMCRQFGIAVVLRATEEKWRTMYTASYDFGVGKNQLPEGQLLYALCSKWNLEHDNYDDQDRLTQLFVGSLLGVV